MAKKKKNMHTIEFVIDWVEGCRHPRDLFDRRFYMANHIHNVMVKEAKRRLVRLYSDKKYRALLKEYGRRKEAGASAKELKAFADMPDGINEIRESYGLTEGDFESWLKVCGKQFAHHISSQQVQKLADNVWQACESVLFKNGKQIHFRKLKKCMTVSQKNINNGVRCENFGEGNFVWCGTAFHAKIEWNDPYVTDSLVDKDGNLKKISYFEIHRRIFPSGWRYYLRMVIEGPAPHKIEAAERSEATPGGIDLGTSTVAFVSENKVLLERLVPKSQEYGRKIRHLQKKQDKLYRLHNPDCYNEDGTPKKGYRKKVITKHMKHIGREIQSLYRTKSEYISQYHDQLANQIVKVCSELTEEPMDFASLQKRSKKTERSDILSSVKSADSKEKQVYKYKKKKRFGHSVNDHAPGLFAEKLEKKCLQYDIPVSKINTKKYKASQYDPISGEYKKSPLSERIKNIGGHKVQRDLLSAYVISKPDESLEYADAEECLSGWDNFLIVHDKCISEMKAHGISFKQCFGF